MKEFGLIFMHPEVLAKTVMNNLFNNYGAIMKDLNQAMSDWDHSNFFSFGNDIGTLLVLTLKCSGDECP